MVREHLYTRVFLYPVDQVGQERSHISAIACDRKVPGQAAQFLFPLDQGDVIILIGQVEGSRHACHTSADHQCSVDKTLVLRVEWLQAARAGHGHARQFSRLLCSSIRPFGVYPRVLVADVGHLKQVGVQPGLPDGVPKDRLVRARRARRYDDPVQALLLDPFLNQLQRVGGAGVHRVFGMDHVRKCAGILGDIFHVDDPGDIAAATADEHADAGLLFRGHGRFRRVLGGRHQRASCLPNGRQGRRRRAPSLDDAIGDVFGFGKGTAHIDTTTRCFHWLERLRLAETVRINLDPR